MLGFTERHYIGSLRLRPGFDRPRSRTVPLRHPAAQPITSVIASTMPKKVPVRMVSENRSWPVIAPRLTKTANVPRIRQRTGRALAYRLRSKDPSFGLFAITGKATTTDPLSPCRAGRTGFSFGGEFRTVRASDSGH
jgi:hypothetical protein